MQTVSNLYGRYKVLLPVRLLALRVKLQHRGLLIIKYATHYKADVTDGVRFEITVRLIPSTISSISSEMPQILILTQTLHGITAVFIHELSVITRPLDSVAQLVRALHRNRRAAGSIAVRGPIYSFISRNCCNKYIIN